jgi:hypothetical protein
MRAETFRSLASGDEECRSCLDLVETPVGEDAQAREDARNAPRFKPRISTLEAPSRRFPDPSQREVPRENPAGP